MMSIVQIALLVIVGFPVLYLCLLSTLALFTRRRTIERISPSRTFAIVVPAHNEEGAITRTTESLLQLDYPRELFDVIAVADNCTDATAQRAAQSGALVLERVNPLERGKGYALRWCFDRLLQDNKYQAIVVIDADSIAAPDLLRVMDCYLNNGSLALQSSDLVEPQPDAWSAEATRLGFFLYNYVRPLGRRALGGHAGTRGNGMCFSVEVLKRVPWSAYSQSEDLEYGLDLLLQGISVDFAPEALVLATMPSSAKNAESQRSRWEAGRLPIIKRYAMRLFVAAVAQRSFKIFDALLDLLTPALVNLIGLTVLLSVVNFALWLTGVAPWWYALAWVILTVAGILHMVIGVMVPGADQSLRNTIVHIPRYALWKMLLYLRLIKRGHTKEWVRTTRESPGENIGQ